MAPIERAGAPEGSALGWIPYKRGGQVSGPGPRKLIIRLSNWRLLLCGLVLCVLVTVVIFFLSRETPSGNIPLPG